MTNELEWLKSMGVNKKVRAGCQRSAARSKQLIVLYDLCGISIFFIRAKIGSRQSRFYAFSFQTDAVILDLFFDPERMTISTYYSYFIELIFDDIT